MFSNFLFFLILHSWIRWLLFMAMLYAICRAGSGLYSGRKFSAHDDAIRHWTATIAHIQLVLGIILYMQSPIVKYFWRNTPVAIRQTDIAFFSCIHSLMMLVAIVMLTIGSSIAKRKTDDHHKFRIMLTWFLAAFLFIIVAIPWPFSPFSQRVLFRPL